MQAQSPTQPLLLHVGSFGTQLPLSSPQFPNAAGGRGRRDVPLILPRAAPAQPAQPQQQAQQHNHSAQPAEQPQLRPATAPSGAPTGSQLGRSGRGARAAAVANGGQLLPPGAAGAAGGGPATAHSPDRTPASPSAPVRDVHAAAAAVYDQLLGSLERDAAAAGLPGDAPRSPPRPPLPDPTIPDIPDAGSGAPGDLAAASAAAAATATASAPETGAASSVPLQLANGGQPHQSAASGASVGPATLQSAAVYAAGMDAAQPQQHLETQPAAQPAAAAQSQPAANSSAAGSPPTASAPSGNAPAAAGNGAAEAAVGVPGAAAAAQPPRAAPALLMPVLPLPEPSLAAAAAEAGPASVRI